MLRRRGRTDRRKRDFAESMFKLSGLTFGGARRKSKTSSQIHGGPRQAGRKVI